MYGALTSMAVRMSVRSGEIPSRSIRRIQTRAVPPLVVKTSRCALKVILSTNFHVAKGAYWSYYIVLDYPWRGFAIGAWLLKRLSLPGYDRVSESTYWMGYDSDCHPRHDECRRLR